MRIRERVHKLPILVPEPRELKDNECVDEEIEGGKLIISHHFIPITGPQYCASFSGSPATRQRIASLLIEELGKPVSFDELDPNCWRYFWTSPCQEIPVTPVQTTLGDQYAIILQQKGLSEDEQKIIGHILIVLAVTPDQPSRLKAITHLVKDLSKPQRERTFLALAQVNLEFARIQIERRK